MSWRRAGIAAAVFLGLAAGAFAQLEGRGELQVIDGKLRIEAPAYDIRAMVPEIDLRLRSR